MREFGELEMAIMDVMWAADSPCVVREVRERLQYGRPVAYTTVMTVMTVLHRKGVLNRSKHGRAWRYWPVEQREEHAARLMAEVLRSGGDEDLIMRRFLERVSDDEMERLRSAVHDLTSRRLDMASRRTDTPSRRTDTASRRTDTASRRTDTASRRTDTASRRTDTASRRLAMNS